MRPDRPEPWSDADPGEAPTWLDRGDVPGCRWESGLPDESTAAHREGLSAHSANARDGGRPLVPPLRIRHDLPDPLRGCGDVRGDGEVSHRSDSERCWHTACSLAAPGQPPARTLSSSQCAGASESSLHDVPAAI